MNEILVQLFQRNVDQRITPELANGMIHAINQAHERIVSDEMKVMAERIDLDEGGDDVA